MLLVGVGVVLGATVFRTDIAQATGLDKQAQNVIVKNTSAQAVPVLEQNLDGGNIKVHEQGTVPVNVGNIVSVQGIPPRAFSVLADGTSVVILGSDPVGTHYALSSLTFTNASDQHVIDGVFALSGGCLSGSTKFGPVVELAAHSTVHLDFPQPYVLEGACLAHNIAPVLIAAVGYRF
jgi:hypothetical protein